MKHAKKTWKKTWKFSFSNGALDCIKRLPVTEIVEGEEHTFTPARVSQGAEGRAVKRAIRDAMKERLARAREGTFLSRGTGTYKDEGGKIMIEFDPPASETS
jgi:hypothetical protein